MTYEVWGRSSCNMIDWTEDLSEALEMVQAYLDVGEAGGIELFVHDGIGASTHSLTGPDLIRWAEMVRTALRPTG